MPHLKDHLLARLSGQPYDGDEHAFTDTERASIQFVNNRFYRHKVPSAKRGRLTALDSAPQSSQSAQQGQGIFRTSQCSTIGSQSRTALTRVQRASRLCIERAFGIVCIYCEHCTALYSAPQCCCRPLRRITALFTIPFPLENQSMRQAASTRCKLLHINRTSP